MGTQLGIPKVSEAEMLDYVHNVLESGFDKVIPNAATSQLAQSI